MGALTETQQAWAWRHRECGPDCAVTGDNCGDDTRTVITDLADRLRVDRPAWTQPTAAVSTADLDRENDLRRRLDFLGDNPFVIADRLAALNIRGHRMSAATCPLARYLKGWYPRGAFVGSDTLGVYDGDDNLTEIRIPAGLAVFTAAFDLGHFPMLIDNGGE